MAKAPIDVRFYRSSVKGRRPAPADMGYGDLAINYHHEDPALIIKGDDNALIEFSPRTPWQGAVDTTAARAAGYTPVAGDLLMISTAGTAHADWPGVKATAAVGDVYLFDGSSWKQLGPDGTIVDATTAVKGVVQLADSAAITAGTAGLVVDAAQLKAAVGTGGGGSGADYSDYFVDQAGKLIHRSWKAGLLVEAKVINGYQIKIDTRLGGAGNAAFKLDNGEVGPFDVDWGDGTVEKDVTNSPRHTYAVAGAYLVTVILTGARTFQVAHDSNASALQILEVLSVPAGAALNMYGAWSGCHNLYKFPFVSFSDANVTDLSWAWSDCSSLTMLPPIDTAGVTSVQLAWSHSGFVSFPPVETATVTNFIGAWKSCPNLLSLPALHFDSGTDFREAWKNCISLQEFPTVTFPKATNFLGAWSECISLKRFPTDVFNASTTCVDYASAFDNCAQLTAQSIENILISIISAGASSGTLGLAGTLSEASWTPSAKAGKAALVAKGWTITNTP